MLKRKRFIFQKKSHFKRSFLLFSSSLSIFLMSLFCPHQTFSENFTDIPIDYSAWSTFAPNIQNCSLGQFTLPDPATITLLKLRLQSVSNLGPEAQAKINSQLQNAKVTIEIFGWQNKLCHVVFKSAQQIQNADDLGLGPLGFECNFTREDMQALSIYAQKLAAGQISLLAPDPTAQIKGKACKTLVDSVPPPPETNSPPAVYFIR